MASSADFPASRPDEYLVNLERPANLGPVRTAKSYDRPESPSRSRVLAEREGRALSPSRSRVNSERGRESKVGSAHIDDDHGGSELVPLTGSPRTLTKSLSSPSHSTSVTVKRVQFSSLFASQSSSKERRQKNFNPTEFAGLSEAISWIWGGSGFSGVVCMTLSSLAYSLMGLLVKLLAVHSVPSFETVFIRCAVIGVVSFIGLKRTGYAFELSTNVRDLLVARAATGFLGLCGFLYSIHALPTEDATVLSFTSLAITAILASFSLNENWAVKDMAGSACNLVGVVLVMLPTLLRGQALGGESMVSWIPVPSSYYILSVFIALIAAALGAASFCLVRAIGRAGEPPLVPVFAFAVLACPASLLCMFIFQTFVMPGILEFLGMILVSFIALLAQVLCARALQLEKAGRATFMLYFQVVILYVLEVTFLGKTASITGFLGVAVILISTGFTIYWGIDRNADHSGV